MLWPVSHVGHILWLSLGSIDLAWYTSGESTSILDANDTPHHSPLHRFWFFRGSSSVQSFLFATTALLAVMYTLGHPQCPKLLLWLLVVAQPTMPQQCARARWQWQFLSSVIAVELLLTHGCGLELEGPVAAESQVRGHFQSSHVWVLQSDPAHVHGNGLSSHGRLAQSEESFFPFRMAAAAADHYALSGSFAVCDNVINRFIQHHALVSQSMTLIALVVETLTPTGCVFVQWLGLRQSCAFLLVALHFGLLLSLRLPHWQLLSWWCWRTQLYGFLHPFGTNGSPNQEKSQSIR
jgi:hypothetical protein